MLTQTCREHHWRYARGTIDELPPTFPGAEEGHDGRTAGDGCEERAVTLRTAAVLKRRTAEPKRSDVKVQPGAGVGGLVSLVVRAVCPWTAP
jgi:hypothetical protein